MCFTVTERFVYLFFFVTSDSSIYQTIMVEKLQIPMKRRRGIQIIRKMKQVLLSFHDRFLNFKENIGISETRSQENIPTNNNRQKG